MVKLRIFLVLAALLAGSASASAQGCGSSNPNCIVPTRPPGTSDNSAASTAFVQQAVTSGGTVAIGLAGNLGYYLAGGTTISPYVLGLGVLTALAAAPTGTGGIVLSSKLVASLGVTRTQIPGLTIDASVNTFSVSGYAATGDLGQGAVYVRGGALNPVTSADGATWGLSPNQPMNVGFFGAKCDNVTDDNSVGNPTLQNAESAAESLQGGVMQFPTNGALYCLSATRTLSVTGSVNIRGGGRYTGLRPGTTLDGIDINTTAPVYLRDFAVYYASAAAANTNAIAVTATGSGNENIGSIFGDIFIANPYDGINFIKASKFAVNDNTDIEGAGGNCYAFANLNNPDSGDGSLNLTTCAGATGDCWFWQSGGGLRIENSKCLVATDGLNLALASGVTTGEIFLVGDSIENITEACVRADRQGTTGVFHQLILGNNECFTTGTAGTTYDLYVPSDANGAWLTSVSMTGGTFYGTGTGSNVMANVFSTNGFVSNGETVIPGGTSTYLHVIGSSTTGAAIGPTVCAGSCSASLNSGTSVTEISPY